MAKSSRGDPQLTGRRGRQVVPYGLIGAGCLFLFVVASLFMMFRPVEPERGYNVDSVSWLPNEASNITFYAREGLAMLRIAEGSMSEADFREWADSKGWDLEEKKNSRGSGYLRTAFLDLPEHQGLDQLPEDFVRDGLYYENRASNGGGVTVLFDREKERFYYSVASR